jgi:DNA-binding GntR family transcriptional regulator
VLLDPTATTLSEGVFRKLRSEILLCRLAPGRKLRIAELTLAYGVSGSSVREGLCRLAAAGLVKWEGQRGFRVADISVDELLDLTKNRIWIETIALRAAISRGQRDWEAEILAAGHRLGPQQPWYSPENPEDLADNWITCHRAFHRVLVSACGSPQLLSMRETLHDLCDRYKRMSGMRTTPPRNLATEHKAIMDAVLNRDTQLAVTLIEEHFVQSVEVTLKAMGSNQAAIQRTMAELKAQIRAGTTQERT